MEYISGFYSFVTNGVPSYTQTCYDIKWGLEYWYSNVNDFSPQTFSKDLQKYALPYFEVKKDLAVIVGLAVLWTILRYALTFAVFQPIASWCQLRSVDAKKYPESAWKLLVYIHTWAFTCYVIFGLPQYNNIYYDTDSVWDDFESGMPIESTVYLLYMLQLSFYVHSIYGTICMDAKRKDTLLMLFHHFLTISLIGFSYASRYHKIGLMVLFVHDVTDIALEFTKVNVYFKNRGGQFHRLNEIMSNVGFVVFAICWYLFRLYWLPLKVLHSTGYSSMIRHQQTNHLPFYLFFNIMLWILQGMNIYWFMFILYFLFKVATGQMTEVDDVREDEVVKEAMVKARSKSSTSSTKNTVKNKSRKTD